MTFRGCSSEFIEKIPEPGLEDFCSMFLAVKRKLAAQWLVPIQHGTKLQRLFQCIDGKWKTSTLVSDFLGCIDASSLIKVSTKEY